MARTKRDAPSVGTLGGDDLQRWLAAARAGLGGVGISATFGRAPTIGGAPGATWVSMTSATAHGRLIRAADGSTAVTAHALPDSATLLDERHRAATTAQLDALVAAVSRAPEARPGAPRSATAGRP